MACTSSNSCGPSGARGGCIASCNGEICACSDTRCRPGITTAPAGAEYPARFAAQANGSEQRGDAVVVFVRECDGSVELLVYSEDGMRLIESRLLLGESESVSPARLALAEADSS
ncbi:hypothetical protein [Longimicrobium sp.]|uniref:hypothetical protein n=1 Tax=Longimicrobium sp. TaxID=2029185 RepID=UPI003B3A13CE